ncbi:hypothetical protein [Bartonella heixiaziensis]
MTKTNMNVARLATTQHFLSIALSIANLRKTYNDPRAHPLNVLNVVE